MSEMRGRRGRKDENGELPLFKSTIRERFNELEVQNGQKRKAGEVHLPRLPKLPFLAILGVLNPPRRRDKVREALTLPEMAESIVWQRVELEVQDCGLRGRGHEVGFVSSVRTCCSFRVLHFRVQCRLRCVGDGDGSDGGEGVVMVRMKLKLKSKFEKSTRRKWVGFSHDSRAAVQLWKPTHVHRVAF